jgi:thiol-disulfide isomerase/thioredoxin
MATFLSPLDNKCRHIELKIEKLGREFATIKFYQVDVTKHAMLRSLFLGKDLPTIVFIYKGEDFLVLDNAPSLQDIREGLEALRAASE